MERVINYTLCFKVVIKKVRKTERKKNQKQFY